MTKTNTHKNWALKNIASGKVYYNFSAATRSAARKLANTKRFKGLYTPVKLNNVKPLKPIKPTPTKKATHIAATYPTKTTEAYKAPTACPSTTSKHGFHAGSFQLFKKARSFPRAST
jgi:hypothetical protein